MGCSYVLRRIFDSFTDGQFISFCDSSPHFIFLELKISNSGYAVLLIFQISVVPKMSAVAKVAVLAVF